MARLSEMKYTVTYDDEVVKYLSKIGYDEVYGARPLKRAVQNYVEDILADAIISKKMVMGSKIYSITHKKGEDKLSLK